jgi:hypothetical protein
MCGPGKSAGVSKAALNTIVNQRCMCTSACRIQAIHIVGQPVTPIWRGSEVGARPTGEHPLFPSDVTSADCWGGRWAVRRLYVEGFLPVVYHHGAFTFICMVLYGAMYIFDFVYYAFKIWGTDEYLYTGVATGFSLCVLFVFLVKVRGEEGA